ncbi:DUF4129 domain-containing protein [Paenibacillus abyssi]|uniref:Protein-glutamine gamma-glutamyltransferase-like C-terminal domain-containing protein n=1 Tax=Paenibacillus abyssi TaxID=1340531 RepID=A0A917CIZ4_9BACL|nr:DUF4129 domain-containing protein [Paenibacillus abyssi]GGF90284.1 hypothetical protein GCM10010916_04590 [Paenibacillus abyssi]
MNKTLSSAGASIVKGAVELLMFLPAVLVILVYVIVEPVKWLWLGSLPLLYGIGYAGNVFFGLNRYIKILLFAAPLAFGYVYLLFDSLMSWILLGVMSMIALQRGVKMNGTVWRQQFGLQNYIIGLVVYFATSVILRLVDGFEPYLPLLTWFGIAALSVTLYVLNTHNIYQETFSNVAAPAVSSSVWWHNRLQIVMLLAIALVITLFQKIEQGLLWLRDRIRAWLQGIGSEPEELVQPSAQEQLPPQLPQMEPAEPSKFMIWLEKIGMVLVYLFLAALALVLLYQIGKRAPVLFMKLYRVITRLFNKETEQQSKEGFVDEVETLFELKGWKERLADKLGQRRMKARSQWSDNLSNEEKVRYLYRQWLTRLIKNGYKRKTYHTPKETMREIERSNKQYQSTSGEFLSLYEQARYGHKDVSDQEVRSVKKFVEEARQNQ